MNIICLAEKQELLPIVASLLHAEWGSLYPGQGIETRITRLKSYLHLDRIPFTLIAVEGSELLGTASAILNDMDTHPDWEPWLASVYVLPAWRGLGIGSALAKDVAKRSSSFGAKELYLWTEKGEGFYNKLEWKLVVNEVYKGRQVSVMLKTL